MVYRVRRFITSKDLWDRVTTAEEKLESFLNDSRNKIDGIDSIFVDKEYIVLVYTVAE